MRETIRAVAILASIPIGGAVVGGLFGALVGALGVATGKSRHGLARAVMHAWMARAASQGAARAFLEVAADNSAALPLYESCGFALCGVRRDYYRREGGAAADALLLACPLPGGRAAES